MLRQQAKTQEFQTLVETDIIVQWVRKTCLDSRNFILILIFQHRPDMDYILILKVSEGLKIVRKTCETELT